MCLSPIENGTARRRCRFIFGRINRGDGRNAQIAAMIGGGGIVQDTRRAMARNGANAPSMKKSKPSGPSRLAENVNRQSGSSQNGLYPRLTPDFR